MEKQNNLYGSEGDLSIFFITITMTMPNIPKKILTIPLTNERKMSNLREPSPLHVEHK